MPVLGQMADGMLNSGSMRIGIISDLGFVDYILSQLE